MHVIDFFPLATVPIQQAASLRSVPRVRLEHRASDEARVVGLSSVNAPHCPLTARKRMLCAISRGSPQRLSEVRSTSVSRRAVTSEGAVMPECDQLQSGACLAYQSEPWPARWR